MSVVLNLSRFYKYNSRATNQNRTSKFCGFSPVKIITPANHGLEQAKRYAKGLNVPFVYSSNGHLFVEYDKFTGITSKLLPLDQFPMPDDLIIRYEQHMGFSLEDPIAKPLLTSYTSGEAGRHYYQDAAIRTAFEKIAKCEKQNLPKRVLLSLATGTPLVEGF